MRKQREIFLGAGIRPEARRALWAMFLALSLALAGCAQQRANVSLSASDAELAADLAEIPQDPFYFARLNGAEAAVAPLLSPETREGLASRAIQTFFSPWGLKKASSKPFDALWGYYWLNPERGYMENLRPYSPERWAALARNADILNYPSRALPAITVDRADLRLMPTSSPYFFEPARPGQGYPFDYYQNSSLPLGTPVLITHVSQDGAWALVESPSAGGWVERERLALVDAAFMIAWKSRPMGAVLRENTPFRPLGAPPQASAAPIENDAEFLALLPQNAAMPSAPRFASIGTVLPLEEFPAAFGKSGNDATLLYYPIKGEDGYARMEKALLPNTDIAAWPLELTKENMAMLMAQMIGQPYGWGGYGGNRDCSSTLRDLYLSFGAWLPRNSRAQAGTGEGLSLAKLTAEEKEETILREGLPFLSLVGLPGHIMLYLGEYQGRAVVFHNMWGLRTVVPGSDAQGRAIIGKAVITSLSPGRERGDLALPNSLLDNVNRLSFPLGRE